ncbi:glucosidase II beta subunit-like protein [Oesophagostomum dentatum]|uniref:Endoplasmic reticulum lectin 1 n=1 Tax=Oesophagostomum dentatum TaxID=61180 RepID=A0A0B1TAE8_OESDE|nr:glucosidase II beta subunit-like protein [Oesophagostomum dentatum]
MAWTRSATTSLTARHPAAGVHLLAMLLRRICILLVFGSISCFATKVDDSVHYLITFERAENGLEGGQLLEDNEKALRDDNSLRISTQNNENYICKMPAAPEEKQEKIAAYTGPTPAELLAPVYKEKVCSYRVEPYWSYELCHGRYIVQFHEEKDVRGVGRTAEYYLGNLHVDYTTAVRLTSSLFSCAGMDYNNPPKKVIDGEEYAYYPVYYSQGTTCDITGKPRTTTVMYICVENARNQIHSLSEVSSCNYEVIVLSSRLCTHPAYRPKSQRSQEIICYNIDNNENSKPLSLLQMESYHIDKLRKETVVIEQQQKVEEPEPEEENYEPEQEAEATEVEPPLKLAGKKRFEGVDSLANNRLIVEDTVNRIISGRECIYGGEGWWKYEFCYGKSVRTHMSPLLD